MLVIVDDFITVIKRTSKFLKHMNYNFNFKIMSMCIFITSVCHN